MLLKINQRSNQMKRVISGFLIVTIGIIMFGCSKIDSPPNNAKAITEFKFISQDATGIITETTHTIAITVPYGTDVTSLTPTITHTGTSISPVSGETQNFTNPVTYTVTAADSSIQAYIVTVAIALNPAKAITAFNFISPVTATGVITEADHTITITVPYGTDVKSLTPTIIHTGVSVSPASGVAHDFTNPATYIVTAANSSTQAYTVTVTQSITAKAITSFNYASLSATGVITESSHTITVTVPSGTDVKSLTPTITHTGVSVNPASGVAHDFTDPATYTVTAGDSLTQDYTVTVAIWTPISGMISVPAGTFSRDGVSGNDSTVSAFHMSDKEITRSLFTTVTGLPDPSDTRYTNETNDPVQMVNWYHALVFCNKLSALEGRTPVYSINGSTDPAVWITANGGVVPTASNADWDAAVANWSATGYRLPTEMEWMWAAMGADAANPGNPNTTGYAKAFAGSTGSNAIGNYAWTSENSSGTTHPAGTKLANELDLYDMSGNVFEWCWDWWTDTFPSGALSDYRGAASGTQRVGRGGTFLFEANPYASIAYRSPSGPSVRYSYVGFRIVRQP
jgi:formylglycine-generating enzyme required for sulfatase activity